MTIEDNVIATMLKEDEDLLKSDAKLNPLVTNSAWYKYFEGQGHSPGDEYLNEMIQFMPDVTLIIDGETWTTNAESWVSNPYSLNTKDKEGLYEIRDDIGKAEWTILTHQNTGKKMLTSLEGYNPQRFYFNPDRKMMPDTLHFSGESKTREPILSRGKHTIPIEHTYRYSDEINDWSYKLSIISEDFQE